LPICCRRSSSPPGAIAIAAGPRLGAVQVPAIPAGVRVLDADQLEITFPIRAFLFQRRGTETGFDPMGSAIRGGTSLFHVVLILVTRKPTRGPQRAIVDGLQKGLPPRPGFTRALTRLAHRLSLTNIQ